LRDFCRKKLIDYVEIFLKKDIQIAKENDIKKIYKTNISKTPIVGIDINFQEPKHSNLTIHTDKTSIEKSFQKIINFLEENYEFKN